ncbi:sulfotransferase [Paenalcaligenes faecalis]|uniref:sulfotransferase n=1 Tax=Paenalcaligenes faecalis TaxID=2980099 RepID=UPI0022B985A0|nr:sulfotransferase [Paenalcaligenes faecalis]
MARPSIRKKNANVMQAKLQIAIDLLKTNQLVEAANKLKEVRRQYPTNAQAMALHGDALRRLERMPEAIDAYQAAYKAGIIEPRLHLNLASCLVADNQSQSALAHIEELLKKIPNHADVIALKGDALHKLKQPELARDCYRQALTLNPNNPRYYAAISALDRFTPNSKVFNVLKKFLESEELNLKDRGIYLSTLAKAYLDIGNDTLAFDYFHQANQLMDQNLPAINYELESLLTRTRQRFTPSLFAELSPYGSDTVPQIIVTGMSRAGKSLVESLFNGVQGVHLAGEEVLLSQYKIELLKSQNLGTQAWLAAQTPESTRSAAAGYLEKLQENTTNPDTIQVTTIPGDLWNLGLIGLWLPNVPIIFCVRNPLDLGITGYFQQYDFPEYFKYSYNLHQLGRQIACTEKAMEHWAQVLPNPVYLVDYEALVANPEQVMNNLLSELGLKREESYEETIKINADLATTLSPIVSVDAPMPITDRLVGISQRFIKELEPLIQGYHTIVDEFPRLNPPATLPHPLPTSLIDDTEASEPSHTTDFSWNLPEQITIIDNGGNTLQQKQITDLVSLGSVGLVVFDPAGNNQPSSELQSQPTLQYVTQALLGSGAEATLHLCLDSKYNSSLSPLSTQNLQSSMQVLAQLPMPTYALDHIEGLENLDWLVLDAQHANLSILDHGVETIKNTLLIQADVWLQPLYAEQSSLSELSQWAEQHGFRLYSLINMQYLQNMPSRNDLTNQPAASQLQQATMLFVPNEHRLALLSNNQKLKLAFILDTIFQIHDFTYQLLLQIDEQLGENYLRARGFFDHRFTGPNYDELEQVRVGLAAGEYAVQGQKLQAWAQYYPDDAKVQSLLAQLASHQNHTSLAIYHINKALALAPDDLNLRLESIGLLLQTGMWWEAINDAKQLYQRLPSHPKVIQAYTQALEKHPSPKIEDIQQVLISLNNKITLSEGQTKEGVDLLLLKKKMEEILKSR